MGAANEVAFTCDSRRLLGAGSDKRLLVWNTLTGQVHARARVCVHTCCVCSDGCGGVLGPVHAHKHVQALL